MWLWVALVLASSPFSIPSFYLAHKLIKKRFLDSVFNQHIALMMIFAGVILPFNLASPLLRLLIYNYPEALAYYESSIPLICVSFAHFYGTWISSWYYMSITAIIFRFVLVKYVDRGLVNDRYYYNMNMTLFKTLFWIINISFFFINQGNFLAYSIKYDGASLFHNTYRSHTCQQTDNLEDLLLSHRLTSNPDSFRNGNLVMKTMGLVIVLVCTIGIYWKKNRKLIRARRCQYNVMTLNQTVLLVSLLNVDSAVLSYFLQGKGRLVFTLEMLRTILIENIFFKTLVPLYLILQSRTHLKSLWADKQPERRRFFMSKQKIVGRPVVSRYQSTDQQTGAASSNNRNNGSQRRNRIYFPGDLPSRNRNHVTITIHAEEKFGDLALVV